MGLSSSTPTTEFLNYLRERAIANNASAVIIDKIDQLGNVEDLERDCEELQGKVDDLEKDKTNLIEELEALCEAASGYEVMDTDELKEAFHEELVQALKIARCALERHSGA